MNYYLSAWEDYSEGLAVAGGWGRRRGRVERLPKLKIGYQLLEVLTPPLSRGNRR
jgi:hypothetical protein